MSIQSKSQLNEKQLLILNGEMEKHKKSTGVAYLLWFFFGSLGIHKFYLQRKIEGIMYLTLEIFAGLILILFLAGNERILGFGIAAWIILGLLLLIDLFTIPNQRRIYCEKKEGKIIGELFKSNNTINI